MQTSAHSKEVETSKQAFSQANTYIPTPIRSQIDFNNDSRGA